MNKILFVLLLIFSNTIFANDIKLTSTEKKYLFSKKILKVCINPSRMPYEEIDNYKHIGITSDYLYFIEKSIGIKIKLLPTTTWLESMDALKLNKCDFHPMITKTLQGHKNLLYTDPYLDIELVLATKIEDNFIENLDQLKKGEKIAIIKEYPSSSEIIKKYPNINFVNVQNAKQGMLKVYKDKTYGYIDAMYTIGNIIHKEYLSEIKIAGRINEKLQVSMAVNNDNEILSEILNKALSTISKKEKQDILHKWISFKHEDNYFYLMLGISIILFLIIIAVILINIKLSSEVKKRKEVEDILKLTIKAASLGTWRWNPQTNENIVNYTWGKILGYSRQEIIDINDFFKLVYPDDIEKINTAYLKHIENEDKHYETEFRMITKNGSIKWIYANGAIVKKNKNNVPTLVVGIHQDITERKMLELEILKQKDMFIQQSRQAAMGEMLENIAHQWRQPLSLITTAASGIKFAREFDTLKDEYIDETMDNIVKSCMYLSQTIDDFRGFLNNDRIKSKTSIKTLISNSTRFLESKMRNEDIIFVVNMIDEKIVIYENELVQCLLNILNNSIDALCDYESSFRCIILDVYTKDNTLYLIIKDNARGIKDDILLKVFEPYFTTKHKSQGTGIGLYMSKEIIEKHMKGKLEALNTDFLYDKTSCFGACFKITIPLS